MNHEHNWDRLNQECVRASRLPDVVISFNPSDSASVDSLLSQQGPEGLYEIADVLRAAADKDVEEAYAGSFPQDRRPKGCTAEVKFSVTGTYGCGPSDEDDVYTVEEFREFVESGAFIDYDGYGHPVKDNMANPEIHVLPSKVDEIPSDATHIVWYNR